MLSVHVLGVRLILWEIRYYIKIAASCIYTTIIKLCSIYIECGHTLIPIYTNVWPQGDVVLHVKHCLRFVVFIIQCSTRNSNLLFQINCHFPTIIQYMYFVLPNSKTLLIYSLPSATNYVDYTVASYHIQIQSFTFHNLPH